MRAVCTVLICLLAQGLFAQEGIEYWFGTDPGAGNGTFIAQGSGDGASLSTSGLPPGNHTVGIRAGTRRDSGPSLAWHCCASRKKPRKHRR